jgi:hypothetical protein
MPKKKKDWNEVRGAYTSDDPGLTRDESALGYHKPVDISNRVDPSWKRTDGFSAKLDKGPKEDA